MRRFCHSHFITGIVAVILVVVVFNSLHDAVSKLLSVRWRHEQWGFALDKKVYRPGEAMELTTNVRRRMPSECLLEVARFISRTDGVVVWSQLVPGIALNQSDSQHIVGVLLPPVLPAGSYQLYSEARNSNCPPGTGNVTTQSNRVMFEIKE